MAVNQHVWSRSLRALLVTVWACFPAFLFYVLVLQVSVVSPSRLAASALLVPPLAYLAHPATTRMHLLSQRQWAQLLAASGVISLLAALALTYYPEKGYLFTQRHTLLIDPVGFDGDDYVELRWFRTALGDISFDSFENQEGWTRSADSLSLNGVPDEPLSWTGWTGPQASLIVSASPGVIMRVSWDGEPRDIDFSGAGRFVQVQRSFVVPWSGHVARILLLWGAILYAAVTVVLNSKLALPQATLPPWAAWALLTGLVLSLALLVLDVPLASLELPLVLALGTLLIAPGRAVSNWLGRTAPLSKLHAAAGRAIERHSRLLIAVASLCLAIGIFGRTVWTEWSPLDDHDLMLFLGPERTLSISQFLRLLPEIGSGTLGIPTRFRPSYWFLRVVECLVWGAQPYLWHAFRVMILVVALILFWNMAASTLGWLASGMLCAYVLTFPYWGEIVGWLGPGETYALAGLPIYIWGASKFFDRVPRARKDQVQSGSAILLGSMICMGAKENFVLLVVPSAYMAFRAFRSREPAFLVFAVASIAFAGYVGGGIITTVIRSGTDVYLHSISLSERGARLIEAMKGTRNLVPILSIAALTVLPGTILLRKGLTTEARQAVLQSQFWMAVLLLVYLSQLVFYNGTWPTGTRYDFPGLLYLPTSVLVFFRLGMALTPSAARAEATQAARSAIAVAMALLVAIRGYGPTIGFLESNVAMTHQFVGGLEQIVAVLHEHEDHALVIESGSSLDYEMIFSYERYLRAYGVKNPLFLRLHGYSLETATYTLESALTANLIEVSAKGNSRYDPLSRLNQLPSKEYPGFSPLAGLGKFIGKCYSLELSGNLPTECKIIN